MEMLEKFKGEHNELCEKQKRILKAAGHRGTWNKEPNLLEWQYAGLPCAIVRMPETLHWCGYVGVSSSHPFYLKDYDEVRDISVHGGLTYSDVRIEADKFWFFGFDCAHFMDLVPGTLLHRSSLPVNDVYRNMNFVKAETEELARQLARLQEKSHTGDPNGSLN